MKAILLKTGILLDVIGESKSQIDRQGNIHKCYKVKKETANPQSTFDVKENEIAFVEVIK